MPTRIPHQAAGPLRTVLRLQSICKNRHRPQTAVPSTAAGQAISAIAALPHEALSIPTAGAPSRPRCALFRRLRPLSGAEHTPFTLTDHPSPALSHEFFTRQQ
jgi:hypothetical protein